jgi:hypothetical protein
MLVTILIMLLFEGSAFGLTLLGAMLVRNKGWLVGWTIYALVFALAFLQAVPVRTDGITAAYMVMLIIVPIAAAAIIGCLAGLYRIRKKGPVPLSGGRLVFPLLNAAVVGQIAVWALLHF